MYGFRCTERASLCLTYILWWAQVPIVTNETADNLSIHEGLETKLTAARYAMVNGVPTVVASGYQWRSILDIVEGKEQGTVFMDI